MDNKFKFTLPGWKLFLAYGLPLFALIVGYMVMLIPEMNNQHSFSYMMKTYAFQIVLTISIYLLYFVIIKMTLNNIEHREAKLEFSGSFWKFVWILLRDGILSLATLGIYGFWMAENFMHYFVENTSFGFRRFNFRGKGGELFKRFLTYMLPFTIVYGYGIYRIIISAIVLQADSSNVTAIFSLMGTYLFTILVLLFGAMVYYYKVIEWMLDLDCGEFTISLETEFWPTFRFISKQFGLCLITFGLFYPATMANIIKYIINHLYIRNEEREVEISNNVDSVSSWGFIFGQYCLSAITLYIYLPWAIVRVLRWFIESTEFEGFEVVEQEPEAYMIEENPHVNEDAENSSCDVIDYDL